MYSPSSAATIEAVRKLYETTCDAAYGTLFKYAALDEIIGRPVQTARHIVYAASRELETKAQRTLQNVLRIGYRIAQPAEHEALAAQQHTKARRRLAHASRVIRATNRPLLRPEELRRLEKFEAALVWHEQALSQLDRRTALLESGQVHLDQTVTARLEEMARRMESLEKSLRPEV